MEKSKVLLTLKKYTMFIALVVVFALFAITTKGTILLPQNITNLLSQNTYAFVLGPQPARHRDAHRRSVGREPLLLGL